MKELLERIDCNSERFRTIAEHAKELEDIADGLDLDDTSTWPRVREKLRDAQPYSEDCEEDTANLWNELIDAINDLIGDEDDE